ncbi:MAG: alpha-ribazole phosphatase [Boseongicola sp.]|nr:histidine phosphatase family protein [Boseongicola sp.]NNL17903.1 alpha-ribazole phosphatase [Boseongicola sp.]
MPLIFLRHPEPVAHKGLCYGRTDLPLAPGFEVISKRISGMLPPIKKIVTSPLTRCRVPAQTIAMMREIPVENDNDLIEMDFGVWENTPWNDISRTELDAWADDFFNARPHQGESVAMLRNRVRSALSRLDEASTLWVSHAGVFRAVMAETSHPDPWNATIGFAEFHAFDLP